MSARHDEWLEKFCSFSLPEPGYMTFVVIVFVAGVTGCVVYFQFRDSCDSNPWREQQQIITNKGKIKEKVLLEIQKR